MATVNQGTPMERSVFDSIINFFGRLVGCAENNLGLRYPVNHYVEKVSDVLWRGSRLENDEDYENLAKNGFKCIVNLCSENDDDELEAHSWGIEPIHIPIEDNTCPTMAQVKTFLQAVCTYDHHPTFVHCEAGKGRTGVMVACYRIRAQGWHQELALKEARDHGLEMPCQEEFIRNFK